MNKQGPNGIDWTNFTLNPISGCWGPGGTAKNPKRCSYCYANAIAKRFNPGVPDPFIPKFHPHRLDALKKIKDPSMIFMCSVSDMFGDWVPEEWILQILETVKMYPQHTFQFLTKNPKRYACFDFSANCWLGTSAGGTNHNNDLWRIKHYHEAVVGKNNLRFLSWEPILTKYSKWNIGIEGWNWFIMGAMTGPGSGKHAPDPQWIKDAVEACRERGIPIFMKKSLKPKKDPDKYWKGPLIQEWPK